MQRRGIKVSLGYFNIRQLWHCQQIRLIHRDLINNLRPRLGFGYCRLEIWNFRNIMSAESIEKFVRSLNRSPSGAVFNPWWQVDKQNDVGRNASAIRRKQLRAYLRKRVGKVKLVVIGEALGYRGGHFSGIPMTSERILLGKKENAGIKPEYVFSCFKARRTSKRERCPDGFSEPTATIVWGTLLRLGLKPEEFVLWNAFPWHSFNPRRGLLSNRMPNKSE